MLIFKKGFEHTCRFTLKKKILVFPYIKRHYYSISHKEEVLSGNLIKIKTIFAIISIKLR